MSDLFDELDNATPLSPEEQRELIPSYIAFRSELNEAEQENIARAQDWGLSQQARSAHREIHQGTAPANARRSLEMGW